MGDCVHFAQRSPGPPGTIYFAEDGHPFSVWDGITKFLGVPSKSASQLISVVGDGTSCPFGPFSSNEINEIYYRVKGWRYFTIPLQCQMGDYSIAASDGGETWVNGGVSYTSISHGDSLTYPTNSDAGAYWQLWDQSDPYCWVTQRSYGCSAFPGVGVYVTWTDPATGDPNDTYIDYYLGASVDFLITVDSGFDPQDIDPTSWLGEGLKVYARCIVSIANTFGVEWMSVGSWTDAGTLPLGAFDTSFSAAVPTGTGLAIGGTVVTGGIGINYKVDPLPDPTIFSILAADSTGNERDLIPTSIYPGNDLFAGKIACSGEDFYAAPPAPIDQIFFRSKFYGSLIDGKRVVGCVGCPEEYWPYKNSSGNPVWSADTGELLAPVT